MDQNRSYGTFPEPFKGSDLLDTVVELKIVENKFYLIPIRQFLSKSVTFGRAYHLVERNIW